MMGSYCGFEPGIMWSAGQDRSEKTVLPSKKIKIKMYVVCDMSDLLPQGCQM